MNIPQAVLGKLDDVLLPRGFERRKTTWNRRVGPFIDVIDVQLSKTGDQMTANVGVLDREIHRQCWGEEIQGIAQEPQCTVRARLGQLVQERDVWWPIHHPEIVDAVAVHAPPFWERMHAAEEMEEFLAASPAVKAKHPYPPPLMYLALLINRRGDRAGACSILENLQEATLGAWKTRVRELAERLGC